MKQSKKNGILCLVLALLLLLASLPFAASAEPEEVVPIIRLSGGQSWLTNIDTGEHYMSTYELTGALPDLLSAHMDELMAALQSLDMEAAIKLISGVLWDVFEGLQMYPDGTSKNRIYRHEAEAPLYIYDASNSKILFDPTAPENIAPVRPAEPPAAEGAMTELTLQPTIGAVAKLSAQAEEPPVPAETSWDYMALLSALGGKVSSAFFGAYDAVQDYIDANGLRGKQPEPDPEWRNVRTSLPDGIHYYFTYDWRMSPVDVADILHRYIGAVKERHNCSKVILLPVSMSNSIALAYIDKYVNKAEGGPEAAGVLFNVSLASGTEFYGSLLQKKIQVDGRALSNPAFLNNYIENPQLDAILDVLYHTGLLDLVLSFSALLGGDMLDLLYDEAIVPILGMFPGMWVMVPPDKLANAKKAMLGDKLNDPEYKPLIDKIDAYHAIQTNSARILREAAEKTKIGVVCSFGGIATFLTSEPGAQGDATVETKNASFGATCSLFGENLGKNYKQKNTACGHDHISPDNTVDASTCALPEKTWFVHGALHGGDYEFRGFTYWWITEENPSVHTSERWPQYLYAVNPWYGGEEDVFPMKTPIYEGGSHFVEFSVFWNRILTAWNKIIATVVNTLVNAVRVFI